MTPSKPPAALAASRHDAERSAGVEMPPLDAWLHRHQSSGAVCMTTGLLAWFEGTPPALPELRALAQRRWGPYARLRLTPGFHPAHLDWPRWTGGPDFDPAQHITSLPATGSAALEGLAAQLLAQPLGPSRPPWQLHLVPVEGGFALLLRAHHALLDGMSLITLLRALLAAPEATAGAVSSPGSHGSTRDRPGTPWPVRWPTSCPGPGRCRSTAAWTPGALSPGAGCRWRKCAPPVTPCPRAGPPPTRSSSPRRPGRCAPRG
ncbi:hypothetical protein GCM10020000_08260 [Streptomyces olivoverticillatus]